MGSMRRIAASLLAAFFSLTLITPALLASGADSNLPACCRRSGQHHCSQPENSSASSVRINKCAAYPGTSAIPPVRFSGLANTPQTVIATLTSDPSYRPQTRSLRHIALGQAGLKRGPPAV